jgi:hypothetical protein
MLVNDLWCVSTRRNARVVLRWAPRVGASKAGASKNVGPWRISRGGQPRQVEARIGHGTGARAANIGARDSVIVGAPSGTPRRVAARAAMLRLPPRTHGGPRRSHAPPGAIMRPARSRAAQGAAAGRNRGDQAQPRPTGRNQAACAQSVGHSPRKCEVQIEGETARAIPLSRRPPAGVPDRGPGPRPDRLSPPHQPCFHTNRVPHQPCLPPNLGPPKTMPKRRTRSAAGGRRCHRRGARVPSPALGCNPAALSKSAKGTVTPIYGASQK